MKKKVYDIINAGPRHRFTVRGKDGRPIIVSNCVQATARDIFAEHLLRIEDAGHQVLFSVHDEVIVECDTDKAEATLREIVDIMSTAPSWMKGIPLAAEGVVADHYLK